MSATAHQMRRRKAVKPKPAPITRESIATMDKPDVIEALKAHGIEDPKGKVADLRDQLTKVMFVD